MADDEMLTMDNNGARIEDPSRGARSRPSTPGGGEDDVIGPDPVATLEGEAGTDRAAQFRDDVAQLAGTSPSARRERFLIRLGVVLLVVGPVWVAVEYLISHVSTSSLEQRDAIIGAMFGGTITVVGAVLFLRYTGARFLRFWLARLSFEQHHHTEQLIDAIRDPDQHG